MNYVYTRTYENSDLLTASYQYGDLITPFKGDVFQNPAGIWQSVALYLVYTQGSATGQAEIQVRWGIEQEGVPFVPAVGDSILLPVGTGRYVVSVDAPGGGALAVQFGWREVGDTGNPGTVSDLKVRGVRL